MRRSPASRRRTRRSDGAVLPLVALLATVLMGSAAFAIDLGALRVERRELQADADVIAIAAAWEIDDSTSGEVFDDVLAEAQAAADRNGYDFLTLSASEVVLGRWANNTFTPTAVDEVPNAVRVDLESTIPRYFDLEPNNRTVSRSAIAVIRTQSTDTQERGVPHARGSLGSTFASLQFYQQPGVSAAYNAFIEYQATFMNSLYTEMLNVNTSGGIDGGAGVTGDPVAVTGPATGFQLDALSYQGLANGTVALDAVATQLGFGTVDELLAADVTAAELLSAAATVLSAGPNAADIAAGGILGTIATDVDAVNTLNLGNAIEATTGQGSAFATTINAHQLLDMTATLVNGDNLINADIPVTIPALPGTLLNGQTTVPVRLAVIEPAQTHVGYRDVGEAGPSTAQVRIATEIPLDAIDLDLSLLGPLLGIQTTTGRIPIVIEAASADSLYESIDCADPANPGDVDFAVETSALSVSIGGVSDIELTTAGSSPTITSEALLDLNISLLGLTINAEAASTTTISETWAEGLSYVGDLSQNVAILGTSQTINHVSATPFSWGTETPISSAWERYTGNTSGILDTTFDNLTLNTTVLPPALDSLLHDAILAALDPIMAELDAALIDPLLSAVGVQVAGAHGQIHDAKCRFPVLV